MQETSSTDRRSPFFPGGFLFKRIVLLFWACYFTIVVASNACHLLAAWSVLPAEWPFVSGNYGMIGKVISIYALPQGIALVMFIGVILLESWTALNFWRAFRDPADLTGPGMPRATRAFLTGFVLWGLFILNDEFFIAYEKFGGIEGAHMGLMVGQVVTFLLVRLVPADRQLNE